MLEPRGKEMQHQLENLRPASGSVTVTNGSGMTVTATGSANLKPACQESCTPVHNVQLIPQLSVNLLSINQIVKKGDAVVITYVGSSSAKVWHQRLGHLQKYYEIGQRNGGWNRDQQQKYGRLQGVRDWETLSASL
ncbi:uncharacterized protein LOC129762710 [Toxorhynchites rutilus septentrionalis]|uniref:uncharacterized protein LOC129762710 n=1 Tax=Toxorhynchites rutilus septentrionalis TaxID=329112 RepID=UPI00247A9DF6|nr:uncharacterized protein LOC129762710 [Toxorhynchites rutilus septentrionalis]